MMTNHHRKPLSKGGRSEARNISNVNGKLHRAWHLLFANKTPYEIARIINEIWLDPDFCLVVERKDQPLPKSLNRYIEEGTNPFFNHEDPDFNE